MEKPRTPDFAAIRHVTGLYTGWIETGDQKAFEELSRIALGGNSYAQHIVNSHERMTGQRNTASVTKRI